MPYFHDITDPGEFLPEPSAPWWSHWPWLLLGIFILATCLYFILRKPSPEKQRQNLLESARASLHQLRKESLSPNTLATRISLIIRCYLEAAFNDSALFETSEEFTLRKEILHQLHPESRESIISHLNQLSQLKYTLHNSKEATTLIDEAEFLLTHIKLNAVSP